MPRINVKELKPLDYLKFMDPCSPQYFELSCWKWLNTARGRIFPSIKPGTPWDGYPIGSLGHDFDGSELGVIMTGPNMGCTIVVVPPQTPEGKIIPPVIN